MEFVRNRTFKIWEETNAGGMDNVPPAYCPPAAYVSACGAAHVERTGGAGTNAISVVGRIVNNTYTAGLDERTAQYLAAQGMQVTEIGFPTGASNRTVLVAFSPKLYALRYLIELFGIGGNQLIMHPL